MQRINTFYFIHEKSTRTELYLLAINYNFLSAIIPIQFHVRGNREQLTRNTKRSEIVSNKTRAGVKIASIVRSIGVSVAVKAKILSKLEKRLKTREETRTNDNKDGALELPDSRERITAVKLLIRPLEQNSETKLFGTMRHFRGPS